MIHGDKMEEEWKTWDSYDDWRDLEEAKKRLEREGYETDVAETEDGIYVLFYKDKVSDKCKECNSLLVYTAYILGEINEAIHADEYLDADLAVQDLKSYLASMNIKGCISPRTHSSLELTTERLQKEIEKRKVPAGHRDFLESLEREILQFLPDEVLGRACFGVREREEEQKSIKKAIQEYPTLTSEEREELMRITDEFGME